jgi:hypothetical protein
MTDHCRLAGRSHGGPVWEGRQLRPLQFELNDSPLFLLGKVTRWRLRLRTVSS